MSVATADTLLSHYALDTATVCTATGSLLEYLGVASVKSRIHGLTHAHIQAYTPAHTHTHTRTQTTHTNYTHTRTQTHTHTYIRKRKHTHTYVRTHTHTHTHTHTYAHNTHTNPLTRIYTRAQTIPCTGRLTLVVHNSVQVMQCRCPIQIYIFDNLML